MARDFELNRLTEWVWRGILGWMIWMVLGLNDRVTIIEASRYTPGDALNQAQITGDALTRISNIQIRLVSELESIERRLDRLENNRTPPGGES